MRKSTVLVCVLLSISVSHEIFATEIKDEEFRCRLLNRQKVLLVMKAERKFIQLGQVVVDEKVNVREVACRFDPEDSTPPGKLKFPDTMTAVARLDAVDPKGNRSIGFLFKEARFLISCIKVGLQPFQW